MNGISRDQLLESAKDYAVRALKAYTGEDNKAALTDATTSLEHLSKAVLCAINPALLVELRNGSFDSLLHLVGEGSKARRPAKEMRTISGAEAIERIRQVVPGIKVPPERIQQLITVRNNVVHAGLFDEQESHQVLAAYLRLSTRLLEELGVPQADMWGDSQELVDSVISETLSETEKTVHRRMARARRTFEEWIAKIPEEQRSALMNSLQVAALNSLARSNALLGEVVGVRCPVCSSEQATCVGGVVLATVAGEPESDVESCQMWMLIADSFVCGVCELHLNDQDELRAAGAGEVVELPDYEPDLSEYMDEGPWTIN